MTNTELNEQVALKLGWTKCKHVIGLDGEIAVGWVRPNPIKPCFHEALPDYSGDIGRAFEVLELAEKEKRQIYIQCRNDYIRHGWCVTIDEAMGEADTAARAICLAFLALDGGA